MTITRIDPWQRFKAKVKKTRDGCWIWTGAQTDGRPYFQAASYHTVNAYVWAWEQVNGPKPRRGMHLHHTCERPLCVNPGHLVLKGSAKEHAAEHGRMGMAALNASKTRCARGHLFDEKNTYYKPPNNARGCRKCRAEDQRNLRERRRG